MKTHCQGIDLSADPALAPDNDELSNQHPNPFGLSPQNLSIHYKAELSKYLSPMAQVGLTPESRDIPDYSSTPPHSTPHIKFVPYGTGTGKSYGAMNQYINFQSMDYEYTPPDQILHREQEQREFTNAVFVTPNKNQISFNSTLIDKMLAKNITPLSALGLSDMYTHSTKLWIGGQYAIDQRLKDYLYVADMILKTHGKSMPNRNTYRHCGVLRKMIKSLMDVVAKIKSLEISKATHRISTEEYDKEIGLARNAHSYHVQQLVMCVLNNTFKSPQHAHNDAKKFIHEPDSSTVDIDLDDFDEDDYYGSVEEEEDVFGGATMSPIEADDVFFEIFAPAKPKTHFDDLIGSVLNETDDLTCMLATLKKDIMRVYAPMNYASYLPSFICMTSTKFRMRAGLFRKSRAKGKKVHGWTYSFDYANYAELIGNKAEYKGAITPVPSTQPNAKQEQLEKLHQTLMLQRTDNRDSGDFDDRTPFAQNDINFYIIIDEANSLFEQDFIGSSLHHGVVKPIMKDFSVTDVLSCIERKYREFCQQSKENIDCYEQNKYFFACMYAYMDRYCEIDAEKVMSLKPDSNKKSDCWLLQFDFPPNIIYIDNGESFSVTDIIKNAFSVTAKKFIDKKNLESIFVCKRGQHRYLSSVKSSDSDITLYDLYQIIIAILFAAIQFEDTTNKKKTKFSAEEREAFRLDLAGGSRNSEIKRQNEPFAALLAFAKRNVVQYKEWLQADHLDNHPDAIVDDWFTYMQTKLLFTLNRNKTFDSSPDIGHSLKVFFDIKLHLVTHHPEIDILRMVVGTKNHLHLMSATSGKTKAYSGQYNIKFIQKWGRDLGVKVNLPEYDFFHNIDYREKFKVFRDHRASMRTIEVITYDDARDAKRLLVGSKKAATKPAVSTSPADTARISRNFGKPAPRFFARTMTPLDVKSRLRAIHADNNSHPSFIPPASYNDKALNNAFVGLFLAFQKQDSTLLISYRSDLFKYLLDSMKAEFAYKNPNREKLDNAIKDKQASVTFAHTVFGSFQLPLLNKYLADNQATLKIGDNSRIIKEILTKYVYMPDFYNLHDEGFGVPAEKIVRLGLYDSSIDKLVAGYRNWFVAKTVKHKGVERRLYTTIVSYNKAAALGLNNVIDNKISGLTEDVNRLFLSSLAFWSDINSKPATDDDDGLDGFGKLENSLVYMRYCADNSKRHPKFISDFDANLTEHESSVLLRHEHSLQKSNNFKQTLGRTEREDSHDDFQSEIILPLADLKEQTKVNYLSYKLNQSFEAKQDATDFSFMSLNNHTVLQHGMKILMSTATSDIDRKKLEYQSKAQYEQINSFVAFDGFIGKLLRAARAGDNESDRELADAAIKFDLAYRAPCILTAPHTWLSCLRTILLDHPILSEKLGWDNVYSTLKSCYTDVSDYHNSESLEIYPLMKAGRTVGLTDFFGHHEGTVMPYCPSKSVLKRIDDQKLISANDSFARLVEFNNKLMDAESSLYDQTKPQNLTLHPAMLHMALGNLGERVFEKFLSIYSGNYAHYLTSNITENFGYRFYEFFDFWLKCNTTKSWVCVDVKNYSHKDNVYQTKRLQASANRKVTAIHNNAVDSEQADIEVMVEQVESMASFFDDSNVIHIVFVNVREGEYSKTRQLQRKVMAGGREITVNIHYLCLFQHTLYIPHEDRKLLVTEKNQYNEKKKPKIRQRYLTINPKLLELLDIAPLAGVDETFEYEHQLDGETYDMTDAVSEVFMNTFNASFTNSDPDIESPTNAKGA